MQRQRNKSNDESGKEAGKIQIEKMMETNLMETQESDWSGGKEEIWVWWKPTGFEKAKQIIKC